MHSPVDVDLESLGLVGPPTEDGPAILIYDIESAPALAYVWGAYDQNILSVKEHWYILCFGYRWLGEKGRKVHVVDLEEEQKKGPARRTDSDLYVAERLQALFDRADIVVAHNGDKFDQRKASSRFLYHGLQPPSPYQQVDTLKIARREFANFQNGLDPLGEYLDLGKKMPTGGFGLWLGCMNGDPTMWRKMRQYVRRDVLLLESLYKRLLPWSGRPGKPANPNMGHWSDDEVCSLCGRKGTLIRRGVHRTTVSEFQTVQCSVARGGCSGYSRMRKRISQAGGKGPKNL